MRIYEENEEECAVKIIGDYLKEEKNIQIKNDIHLTEEKEEQPPDYYFEIGDDKIGCEVRHFSLGKKGINLQKESSDKRTIEKRAERCLQEQGIPVLAVSFDFALPSTEVHKNVEKIVDIITIMHNESITDSNEYQRNNRERYYDLFIENNFDYIRYQLNRSKGVLPVVRFRLCHNKTNQNRRNASRHNKEKQKNTELEKNTKLRGVL